MKEKNTQWSLDATEKNIDSTTALMQDNIHQVPKFVPPFHTQFMFPGFWESRTFEVGWK